MSISNHLNKIKNAVFGKDVRRAIHDAIKQCYDDASINHDNANMEVKLARGTHDTLNDRLNNSDQNLAQTNARLSKKASEVDLAIERERINQLTKLENGSTTAEAELIDIRIGNDGKTYANAGDSVRSQFKNVANGAGINNGVLDPLKITGSKVGINKFNPHTITQGYQLNAETGELYDTNASGYFVSDYIPVNPSQVLAFLSFQSDLKGYVVNDCDRIALYDESKNWLTGWKYLTADTVIYHENMAYLRFSYHKQNADGVELALKIGMMVVDKNEFPPPYDKDCFVEYATTISSISTKYSEKSSISERSLTSDFAEYSLTSVTSDAAYESIRKNNALRVFEQNNKCQTIDENLEITHINAPLSSELPYIAMRVHDIDRVLIEENYLIINYEHILGDTVSRFGVRSTPGNWGTGYNHIGDLKQGINIVDLQNIVDKSSDFLGVDLVHLSIGVGNLTQDTEFKISIRLLPKKAFIHNHVIAHQLLGFDKDDYYKKSEIDEKIGTSLTSDWDSKVIATYGDSITAIGNGNGINLGWQKYVCNYYKFSQHYGRGIGGQSFTWNTGTWWANPDGTYNSREQSGGSQPEGTTTHLGCFCSWDRISTMFSDEIKDNIDLIVVKGGTNDSKNKGVADLEWVNGDSLDTHWNNASENVLKGDYNIDTLKGGIASTIMKLQARCPNAVIVFATPLSGRGEQGKNAPILNGDEYEKAQIIKEVCGKFSIPVIDVFATCGINPLNRTEYISDGVHPYLEKGKKALGRAITMGLKTIIPN